MEIDHVVTPSPLNPLGIKGAGEAGAIPVGPVFRPGGGGCAGALCLPWATTRVRPYDTDTNFLIYNKSGPICNADTYFWTQ
jgi:hypothetical protein